MTTQSIDEDNIHSLYIVDDNASKINQPVSLKQEIYSNNTLIKGSLDKINKTVGTLPDGAEALSFQSALLGALVASFAAYLLNYFHWRSLKRYNNLSHCALLAKEHIKEFENYTSLYWSENKNIVNNHKMIILETQIQATFEIQYAILSQFSSNSLVDNNDKKIVDNFLTNIFDVATGDNFKSHSRPADIKKVWRISKACTQIYTILMKYIKPHQI
ncbi:hypothetical protein [Aeromonas dhakensis]|uniref:hypothetical protein n=1 Tax=Aeromonas dhakensis TaxID=196024 RepID=UPI00191EC286|nr:hypothetical protein [Aeromonas dhakensis]MBL0659224.1 hypothetical protein [Aeromonas dhakensis]